MNWTKKHVARLEAESAAGKAEVEPLRREARKRIQADLETKGIANAELVAAAVEENFSFVVSLYALANSEERIVQLTESHLLARGIEPRPLVERIGRWNRFYLEIVRSGAIEGPLDSAAATMLIGKFFDGTDEGSLAMSFFPLWAQTTRAQSLVREVTDAFLKGSREQKCREVLDSMPEPGRSVALSIWDSPTQHQARMKASRPGGCSTTLALLTLLALASCGLVRTAQTLVLLPADLLCVKVVDAIADLGRAVQTNLKNEGVPTSHAAFDLDPIHILARAATDLALKDRLLTHLHQHRLNLQFGASRQERNTPRR